MNIFGGMKILWMFFWGDITNLDLGPFLKFKVQNGGCLFGLLKYQIFFGVLEFPDIFLG